eukprot:TRINITY_DN541_c0_g1_i1.p1 TRINITY_DN541_c0_g1~~TRINITY_DN541_c0_g1_i1.p1  ORF type:complete len:122 (+),score=24.72 TRINITY_DN541_c0_g1_i1:48-413(+)
MEGVKKRIDTILHIRPILHDEVLDTPKAKCSVLHLHSDNRKVTLAKEGVFDKTFEFTSIVHYKNYSQEKLYKEFYEEKILDAFKGLNSSFVSYGSVSVFIIGRLERVRLIVCLEARLLLMR